MPRTLPNARRRQRRAPSEHAERGRMLETALQAMVLLRRGRWTVDAIAAELGMHRRSYYRLVQSLRAAGVEIESSQDMRNGPAHHRIAAASLRRLLRL